MANHMMMNTNSTTEIILMAALSTLSPHSLSHLAASLSSLFHNHTRRLSSLLSSPVLFSLTIRRLQSLSLHHKSLLIANHLLSFINHHFTKNTSTTTPPRVRLRDLDATLLLLLLCEVHHHDRELLHAPPPRWRVILLDYFARSVLLFSNFGGVCSTSGVLIRYVEFVRGCRDFAGSGELREEAAATSVAAVVGLPSVEVISGGVCVICREEMEQGRDVCELPCGHIFHWKCVLVWLKKRDTCPCCRYQLPTDNVRREIERLMAEFEKIGGVKEKEFMQWLHDEVR